MIPLLAADLLAKAAERTVRALAKGECSYEDRKALKDALELYNEVRGCGSLEDDPQRMKIADWEPPARHGEKPVTNTKLPRSSSSA